MSLSGQIRVAVIASLPVTGAQLLQVYQADLARSQGTDSATSTTYTWAATLLFRYLEETRTPLGRFSLPVWQGFIAWVQTQRVRGGKVIAPRSVVTASNGVRDFIRWATARQLTTDLTLAEWKQVQLPQVVRVTTVGVGQEQLQLYLSEAVREEEPYATVFQLLPLVGHQFRELCWAPLAGVQRIDNVGCIHIRRKGAGIPFEQVGIMSPEACRDQLEAVPLSNPAYAAVRRYLTGYRQTPMLAASPWLFPGPLDPREPIALTTARRRFDAFVARIGLSHLVTNQLRKAALSG